MDKNAEACERHADTAPIDSPTHPGSRTGHRSTIVTGTMNETGLPLIQNLKDSPGFHLLSHCQAPLHQKQQSLCIRHSNPKCQQNLCYWVGSGPIFTQYGFQSQLLHSELCDLGLIILLLRVSGVFVQGRSMESIAQSI